MANDNQQYCRKGMILLGIYRAQRSDLDPLHRFRYAYTSPPANAPLLTDDILFALVSDD